MQQLKLISSNWLIFSDDVGFQSENLCVYKGLFIYDVQQLNGDSGVKSCLTLDTYFFILMKNLRYLLKDLKIVFFDERHLWTSPNLF